MTIAIIVSAHGSVSEQLLKTTEMIVGVQKNVAWTNLFTQENTETLTQKYLIQLSKLNTKIGVLFLVDIWGGSPFNAANNIIQNKKNYNIITGTNIPMLIEVFIARENIHSVQELTKIALKYGKKNIKSAKFSSLNYKSNKDNDHDQNIPSNIVKNNLSKNENKHMTICLVRIDDRLIHGQVVTCWAKEYNIQRIIVINDEISQDTIRKTLISQASPPGITAHVININKAVRVYNNPKYSQEKVIMLFTNPTDVLRLVEQNVPITSINIGNMAFYTGKKQITNTVSIDSTDIKAFKKLNEYNINLEIRKIPSDQPLKIMKLINTLNNNEN